MAASRTSMYLDGHTYSQFDPEEVHRDLRLDPVRARTVMARSKNVAVMHEICDECRDIERENASKTPAGGGYASFDQAIIAHSERHVQYVISRANLARVLGLGASEKVTRMWIDDDPHLLHVVVSGAHYDLVPEGTTIPIARMSRTQAGNAEGS